MRVTIFGSGYVGLVTGACLADAGNHVVCVDVDAGKIERLKRGEVPIHEPGLECAGSSRNAEAGRLEFTTDAAERRRAWAVPAHRRRHAARTRTAPPTCATCWRSRAPSATHLGRYGVVITKSTVPVGTADKVRAELTRRSPSAARSIEFDVVSNPEFLKEGAAIDDFMKPDRVVVGTRQPARRRAAARAVRALHPQPRPPHRHGRALGRADQVRRQRHAGHQDQLHERDGQPRRAGRRRHRGGARRHRLRPAHRLQLHLSRRRLRRLLLSRRTCRRSSARRTKPGTSRRCWTPSRRSTTRRRRCCSTRCSAHFGGELRGQDARGLGPGLQAQHRRHARGAGAGPDRAAAGGRCARCAPTIRWPVAEAQRIYGERAGFMLAKTAYEAAEGADALAIVTEWQEFRSPDFERLKQMLQDAGDLRRPQPLRPGAWWALRLHLLRHRPRQAAGGGVTVTQGGVVLTPVILSGGAGTRLWPLSRELYPKQLLALTGKRTMLQQTGAAPRRAGGALPPIVVCNEAHRFLVAEQLRAGAGHAARDHARARRPQHRAGHRPRGAGRAQGAGRRCRRRRPRAAGAARRSCHPRRAGLPGGRAPGAAPPPRPGKLVTFGIVAARAGNRLRLHPARRRPTAVGATASRTSSKSRRASAREQFVASGDYYWNSGMFLFRARRYLEELQRFAPDIPQPARRRRRRARRIWISRASTAASFEACPANSIDYAVMEKTRDAVVVPLDAGWSDVGSWSSLHEASDPDERRQRRHGRRADRRTPQAATCIPSSRLVAAVGLEITSSSRPRTPCWWRPRIACRT